LALGFIDNHCQFILSGLAFNNSIAFGIDDKASQYILSEFAFNNSIASGFEDKYGQFIFFLIILLHLKMWIFR